VLNILTLLQTLAKGLGERFTSDTAQSYMNPYQQSVVDVEKRKAREDFDQTMQGIGTKAVGAGGAGGSRQAILEGEATSDLGQRLGDIQAIGTKQHLMMQGRHLKLKRVEKDFQVVH
jgi:hypothetical protein